MSSKPDFALCFFDQFLAGFSQGLDFFFSAIKEGKTKGCPQSMLNIEEQQTNQIAKSQPGTQRPSSQPCSLNGLTSQQAGRQVTPGHT